jgi:hypothetical protein
MVRMEVVIDDTKWPKLRIVIQRSTLNGTKTGFTREHLYDTSYSQFENDLHNNLRPMVEELVARRMNTR